MHRELREGHLLRDRLGLGRRSLNEGPKHVMCESWARGHAELHFPSCPLTPFALDDCASP